MRRRRPGVTAAATTAVFAMGEGTGLTALATTAVFATGWPITPTLPTRAGLNGMSISFAFCFGVGFDRREDGLDRNASVGDQLAARPPSRGRKWRRPGVLPDENAGCAAGLHRRREVLDVLGGQQLGELCFHGSQLPEVRDVGQLHRIDSAVLVLGQD